MQRAAAVTLRVSRQAGNVATPMVILLVLCIGLVFVVPAMMLALIGLLPALVAFVVDGSKNRAISTCVGWMNLAGVVPFVLKVLVEGRDFDNTFWLLSDPMNWLMMYGAAALGYAIFHFVPRTVVGFVTSQNAVLIRRLEEVQQESIELWGKEVDVVEIAPP